MSQAIHGYTMDAAAASFREDLQGMTHNADDVGEVHLARERLRFPKVRQISHILPWLQKFPKRSLRWSLTGSRPEPQTGPKMSLRRQQSLPEI